MAAPGERLGPYRIVREIGRGGMGIVYQAVDTTLGRSVALKVVSPELGDDPEFRTRFANEARAQAALDSPHVVQVFAHGEIDGSLYIASQLIPDGDLGALMRAHGTPPPELAVDLIAQVAVGLTAAHEQGVIHRDLKPANVLLRRQGETVTAYLADFGIARWSGVDHGLTAGFAVGTPSYMAPELHTGDQATARSDVYSLGCLLWAALTGAAPYAGSTDYQLVQAHLHQPIPQLAGSGPFERQVNAVLRTAMAKNPAQRFPSAEAMRDALQALSAGVAPPQLPPRQRIGRGNAAPRSAGRSSRRTGWIVAATVAVTLCVIGIAAFLVLRDGTAGAPDEGRGATNEHGLTAEEQQIADELADALVADGIVEQEQADCTAREVVADAGIEELEQAGVVENGHFVEDAQLRDLDVLQAVTGASVECLMVTPS